MVNKVIAIDEVFYKLFGTEFKENVLDYEVPILEIDYQKKSISISIGLLKMVNEDALFGLIAHEAAHLIYCNYSTPLKGCKSKECALEMKKIELACDSIAFYIMKHFGKDVSSYIKGLETIENYLKINGLFDSKNNYHPTLKERKNLFDLLEANYKEMCEITLSQN